MCWRALRQDRGCSGLDGLSPRQVRKYGSDPARQPRRVRRAAQSERVWDRATPLVELRSRSEARCAMAFLPVAGSHQNLSGFPYAAVVKATTASSRLRTGNSIFSLSVSALPNRPASHRCGTACTWEPSSLAPNTPGRYGIRAGDDQSCLHRIAPKCPVPIMAGCPTVTAR